MTSADPQLWAGVATGALFGGLFTMALIRDHKGAKNASKASGIQASVTKTDEEGPFESPFIGALDQGTSSTRFIIFDSKRRQVVSHQTELAHVRPHPGWVEIVPEEIIRQSKECIEQAVEKLEALGYSAKEIVTVGFTNQRETTIIWDKFTGKPVYNAIVWLDTRTSLEIEELLKQAEFQEKGRNHFKEICGLPLNPYFSAMKMKWILDNVPDLKEERLLAGTVDTWLVWNFTNGVHVTDVTNASRTMLMNLKTLQWDPYVCKSLGIPMSILPEIKSSAEVYGQFTDGALDGTPISSILGDQQAALVGHLCFKVGEAKNTYGTGCFLLYNTGEEIVQSKHALTTVAYKLGTDAPTVYALEGAVAIAGYSLRWLQDDMNLISSYPEVNELAGSVPTTNGMYFVPAFSGLLAPRWREDARGVAVGLNQNVKRAHFVRAVLEGVAFQTYDIIEAMNEDSGIKLTTLKASGGMAASPVFLQIQSDILGIEVSRPSNIETTALGAAIAAGMAIGLFKEDELLHELKGAETVWQPTISEEDRRQKVHDWNRAVERSFGWV